MANVEYGDRDVSDDTMEELGDSGTGPLESGDTGRESTGSPIITLSVSVLTSSKHSEPGGNTNQSIGQ